MKKLTVISILLFIGCAGVKSLEKPIEKKPTEMVYGFEFDKVWNATLQSISEYPLTIIEKNSGIINTDWLGKTVKKKVSIWRGLVGGGQVEDEMPFDIQERLNILVTKIHGDKVKVKIIRYVKARPYRATIGGAGNWEPDPSKTYEQVPSDTQTEYNLLIKIKETLVNQQ